MEKRTGKEEKENNGIRINKFLAECGICSRREADSLLDKGLVTVNGKPAAMGIRVKGNDTVAVRGKEVKNIQKQVILAYNKPVGVTCTKKDPHAAKCITDCISYPIPVTYAGRLDKDSEGLILMTNDGDLIDRMMRGANQHEKEYVVKVNKEINNTFLNKMQQGIYLEELKITTRSCEIEMIGKYTFRIVLTQGVNRQIRRMCETLGYRVMNLKRVRVVTVKLNDLKPGKWREITGEEREELLNKIGR